MFAFGAVGVVLGVFLNVSAAFVQNADILRGLPAGRFLYVLLLSKPFYGALARKSGHFLILISYIIIK